MVFGKQSFALVFENLSGCIHIVDHKIQCAIVVQVPIGGSVGVDGITQSPLLSEVFEAQVAKISKSVVGNRRDGNGIDEGLVVDPVLGDDLDLGFFVVDEVEVVQVGDVLVDAIGYENIPLAVVVHVKK